MSKSKTIPYLEKLLAKAADVANLIKIDENGNVNISSEDRKKIVEAGGDLLHKVIVMKSREKLDEMDNEEGDEVADDESVFDAEGDDSFGDEDELAGDIGDLRDRTKSEDEGLGSSPDGEIQYEDDEGEMQDTETLASSDFEEIQKMLNDEGSDDDMGLGDEEESDEEESDEEEVDMDDMDSEESDEEESDEESDEEEVDMDDMDGEESDEEESDDLSMDDEESEEDLEEKY